MKKITIFSIVAALLVAITASGCVSLPTLEECQEIYASDEAIAKEKDKFLVDNITTKAQGDALTAEATNLSGSKTIMTDIILSLGHKLEIYFTLTEGQAKLVLVSDDGRVITLTENNMYNVIEPELTGTFVLKAVGIEGSFTLSFLHRHPGVLYPGEEFPDGLEDIFG